MGPVIRAGVEQLSELMIIVARQLAYIWSRFARCQDDRGPATARQTSASDLGPCLLPGKCNSLTVTSPGYPTPTGAGLAGFVVRSRVGDLDAAEGRRVAADAAVGAEGGRPHEEVLLVSRSGPMVMRGGGRGRSAPSQGRRLRTGGPAFSRRKTITPGNLRFRVSVAWGLVFQWREKESAV